MIYDLDAVLARMIRTLSSPEAFGRLACTCRALSTQEPEFQALKALVGTDVVRPCDYHNEFHVRKPRRSRAIERGTLVVKAAASRCMLGLQWAFKRMPWEEQYRQACFIALAAANEGWSAAFLWIALWVDKQPRSAVDKLAKGSAIGASGILGGGFISTNIMESAVATGAVPIVEWMATRVPDQTDLSELASLAVGAGEMAMLKVLRAIPSVPWGASVWCGAADGGHVHVLQWLLESGCDRGPLQDEYDAAAQGVHAWIADKNVPFTAASFQARSAVVLWLGARRDLHRVECPCACAARSARCVWCARALRVARACACRVRAHRVHMRHLCARVRQGGGGVPQGSAVGVTQRGSGCEGVSQFERETSWLTLNWLVDSELASGTPAVAAPETATDPRPCRVFWVHTRRRTHGHEPTRGHQMNSTDLADPQRSDPLSVVLNAVERTRHQTCLDQGTLAPTGYGTLASTGHGTLVPSTHTLGSTTPAASTEVAPGPKHCHTAHGAAHRAAHGAAHGAVPNTGTPWPPW